MTSKPALALDGKTVLADQAMSGARVDGPRLSTRPRRQNPRYPVHARARVRTQEGSLLDYDARDISRGGLFLATTTALPIFSEVDVRLDVTAHAERWLRARVVHVLSAVKAARLGIQAGMGLQFEPRDASEAEAVELLIEAARASDPRRRIPRWIRGADSSAVRADPMLGYLLDHIDGLRTPERLAEELKLDLEVTEQLLQQLARAGVIELIGSAPSPRAVEAPTGERERAQTPVRLIEPEVASLEPELKRELDALLARLDGATQYQVLGVPADATREHIWRVFVDLTKRFQPDAYVGRLARDELEKLELAFMRVNEAYNILGRPESRVEYDGYLARAQVLVPPDAPRSWPPAPAAPKPAVAAPTHVRAQVQGPPSVLNTPPANDRAAHREAAVASLRRTLNGRGETKEAGRSVPERCIAEAEQAHRAGRINEAARSLQLVSAMAIVDVPLRVRIEALRVQVQRSQAVEFEKQALYEERHLKWNEAVRSWLKVRDGRPDDAQPYRRAALALMQAEGDLRRIVELAKRAVELAPRDPNNRRALGHAFLAAGLKHNARREFEAAAALSQPDAPTEGTVRG